MKKKKIIFEKFFAPTKITYNNNSNQKNKLEEITNLNIKNK